MKRKAMIGEIVDILGANRIEYIPIEHLFDTATSILERIETLGMLPPRTKLQPLNQPDNAWDPEETSEAV